MRKLFIHMILVFYLVDFSHKSCVMKLFSINYNGVGAPFCSLFGFIVLHMLMYSANIFFWRHYRVNYSFIFGFKQGTELGYREVFLLSTGLAVLAFACVISNLDMEMDPGGSIFRVLTELVPLGLLTVNFSTQSLLITLSHQEVLPDEY